MDSNIGDVKLSYSQRFSNYLGEKVTYGTLVWIFLIINMLNYIERSIIPGSSITNIAGRFHKTGSSYYFIEDETNSNTFRIELTTTKQASTVKLVLYQQ